MKTQFQTLSLFLCAVLLGACGGGGGGGGGGDATVNVSGDWSITETMGTNTCGNTPGIFWDQYSISAVQTGNSLTVTTNTGDVFTGSVSGNKIVWTGSYPDDGGTVTVTSTNITVSPDGQSLSGTANWTWSDGLSSCSGTTSISGTCLGTCGGPIGGGGGGTTVDLTGTWFGTNEDPLGALSTIKVTISGATITSVEIGGVNQSLTGSISAESSSIYGIVFNDSSEGGFFLDAAKQHITYVLETTDFGVLQKGATSLPTFFDTDLNGSWAGTDVETDLITFSQRNIYLIMAAPQGRGSFSGLTGAADFFVDLDTFAASFGGFAGDWGSVISGNIDGGILSLGPVEGRTHIFLSADKTFAAGWACDAGFPGGFLNACSFAAFTKQ